MAKRGKRPNQRLRAGAVVFYNGELVAIERSWPDGEHYFLIPGGQVEPGERPDETVMREFREETGLVVRVGDLVATIERGESTQYYYRAEVIGGTFAPGDDKAVLLALDSLASLDLRPQPLRDLIVHARNAGWPIEPRTFQEAPPE